MGFADCGCTVNVVALDRPEVAAAAALYEDGTRHIRTAPEFEALPLVLRREWTRKATVALRAAFPRSFR